MRVEATRLGYYNLKRKRPGDVFVLEPVEATDKDGKKFILSPEKQFSKSWMVQVDPVPARTAHKPVAAAPAKKPSVSLTDEDVL